MFFLLTFNNNETKQHGSTPFEKGSERERDREKRGNEGGKRELGPV